MDYSLNNTALIQANNKVEGSSTVGSSSEVEFKAGQNEHQGNSSYLTQVDLSR